MPYFQTLGVPCAVGMLVAVAVALTLVPAVIVVGGRFGLFDPRRKMQVRGWRRIGTAIVRWPLPILAGASAVALVGLLTLPGYQDQLQRSASTYPTISPPTRDMTPPSDIFRRLE